MVDQEDDHLSALLEELRRDSVPDDPIDNFERRTAAPGPPTAGLARGLPMAPRIDTSSGTAIALQLQQTSFILAATAAQTGGSLATRTSPGPIAPPRTAPAPGSVAPGSFTAPRPIDPPGFVAIPRPSALPGSVAPGSITAPRPIGPPSFVAIPRPFARPGSIGPDSITAPQPMGIAQSQNESGWATRRSQPRGVSNAFSQQAPNGSTQGIVGVTAPNLPQNETANHDVERNSLLQNLHQIVQREEAAETTREIARRTFNPDVAAFRPRSFVPTFMAQYGRGVQRMPTDRDLELCKKTGMSVNYRGDLSSIFNHPRKIPNKYNCSFWICHLPPTVTHTQLLGSITGCGPVYALHINNGEVGERVSHAGAKLVFKTLRGATNFATIYMANQTLFVGGRRAYITRNRNRTPPQLGLSPECTRCIRIRGPSNVVNVPFLMTYFRRHFQFELDRFVRHFRNDQITDLEVRFGSYRSQASLAYRILTTERPFTEIPYFSVSFARDPCDEAPVAPVAPNAPLAINGQIGFYQG